MARSLRLIALYYPSCEDLLERLEDVEEPPWSALREALEEAR